MAINRILNTLEYGPNREADEVVQRWLKERQHAFGLFIDGKWRRPDDAETFSVYNPATGAPLADVVQARPQDVDDAVAAARAAQPQWAALSGHARARYLYGLARHIQKHARLLSVLETVNNGKPIRETRDIDIPLAARHFYHHAGWAQLMNEEFPDHEPLGVIGQIIPWNFPLLMLAWKIAPALAAGNTVVLKPAEYTPLTALAFAELCTDIGLPPGVVNIVTGDGAVGQLIVDHPHVDKIAFTGSTAVGRILRERTAGSGKRLALELGGKSPFIVFDDADMDSAIEGVVDAIWFNQGQVCSAGSRLLVHESIEAEFLRRLRRRMESLRVGDPLDKVVDIGAIVAPVQLQRIEKLVQQGIKEGATPWRPSWAWELGDGPGKGHPARGGHFRSTGWFYPPTLFTDVAPASTIAQEEIFGPVLVSMTFRTPEEAVALANNTPYGLAASVWTENINLALDVAARIHAGVVWVNAANVFDAAAGFGGYKESGFGRDGGREGLYEYVRPRWQRTAPAAPEDGQTGLAGGPGGDRAARAELPEMGRDEGDAPMLPPIDRTPKMYIGGKQTRPDGGYSRPVHGPDGRVLGHVGEGQRKDIRNAVEAAHKASGWSRTSAHNRAQVLYYIGENLAVRADEFAHRLQAMTGVPAEEAAREVQMSIERWFTYAAWADKYDGGVHHTLPRHITMAVPEPMGVIGIACPTQQPLLGFVSLVAPALAVGNRVVVIPSEQYPLAATDLYQVFDTSDVPGGAVNIVTGQREALARVLAEHDDVAAMWYFGTAAGSATVERASIGNLKRTWVDNGRVRNWYDPVQGAGREFLWHATRVKNIWIPYGE